MVPKVFKMFKVDLNIKKKEKEAQMCVRIQHISKLLAEEYSKFYQLSINSFTKIFSYLNIGK